MEKLNFKNKISIFLALLVFLAECFSLSFDFSKAQVSLNGSSSSQIEMTAYIINNENKEIANGEYDVRFAIYSTDRSNVSQGEGSALWKETQKVQIQNGVMRAYMGSTTALPKNLDFSKGEFFLGVKIGVDNEMVPRKKIGAIPLAINAINAMDAVTISGASTGTSEGNILILGKGGKIDEEQLPDIATVGTVSSGNWEGDIIDLAYGGTGLDGSTATNGQLLIGNGAGFSLGNLTAGNGVSIVNQAGQITISADLGSSAVTSMTGTANQIIASGLVGDITLSLPQDIALTSSPTFAGLNLTGLEGVLKATAGIISGSATTSDLSEGTNLYYTDTRSRLAISNSTLGLTYDSASGLFSLTSGYVIPTTTQESNWGTAYSHSQTTTNVHGLTFTAEGASGGLDADLLDGQHGSFYAPLGNLSGTTNYVAKFTGTSTIGNSLIYDNGTNVGIGTTTPNALLNIVHGTNVWGGITIGETSVADEEFHILHYGGTNSGTQLNQEGNLPIRFYTNGFEVMRADGSGNVGIGTSNPESKLEVMIPSTEATIDDTDYRTALFGLAQPNMNSLEFRSGRDDGSLSGRYATIQSWSNQEASARNLGLNPNGGNVGIGTASPQTALQVGGTTGSTFITLGGGSIGSSYGIDWAFNNAGTNKYAQVMVDYDTRGTKGLQLNIADGYNFSVNKINGTGVFQSNYLTIDSAAGNVGIGTTDPTAKLHVAGVIKHTSALYSQGANYTNAWMQFREESTGNQTFIGAGGATVISGGEGIAQFIANVPVDSNETLWLTSDGTLSQQAFRFITSLQDGWANRVEAMTILGNGNVGIGTTSPAQKLDVAGHINLSGATSRTIFYGTTGVAVPGAGSVGEKIQLYGTAGTVGATDYALGIENSNMWFNSATGGYKFYNAGSSVTLTLDSAGDISTGGALSTGGDLFVGGGNIRASAVSDYGKFCMWGVADTTYCIGMYSAQTFGFLNDFAMTFSMSNNADRGWLWRDTSDTASDGAMSLTTDGRLYVKSTASFGGNVGIGTTSPTAYLHLKAGTATASTAPLKFTSGTNLTTAEAGAMEWNGTSLYITNSSAARKTIAYTDSTMTGTFDGINLATGTQGGVGYFSSTTQLTSSTAGTTGQALISGGTGSPTWFAPTAGSLLFAGTSGILAQDNANLFWDNGNDRLGIGTASPSDGLEVYNKDIRISNDASPATLTLWGDRGNVDDDNRIDGTINFFMDNVDTSGFIVNALNGGGLTDLAFRHRRAGVDYEVLYLDGTTDGGNIGIGTTSPASKLQIVSSSGLGFSSNNTLIDTSGFAIANTIGTTINPPSASTASYTASYVQAVTGGSNLSSSNHIYSIFADARHNTTGTITSLIGVTGRPWNNTTGTVNYAMGFNASIVNSSSGTIGSAASFAVQTPTNASGTITNTYGVYINSQTAGTQTNTPYGIYQAGASDRNYFAGNVGIGTTSPNYKLVVSMNASTPQTFAGLIAQFAANDNNNTRVAIDHYGAIGGSILDFRHARGTAASPSASQSGDVLGLIDFYGYGATGYSSSDQARIQAFANENWTDSAHGTDISFMTTASGGTTRDEKMRIMGSGYVGIGTTSPGYSLDVKSGSAGTTVARFQDGAGNSVYMSGYGRLSVGGGPNTANMFTVYNNDGNAPGVVIAEPSIANSFEVRSTVGGTADRFVIKSGGNVGIGTTTPGNKLDVNGSITISNVQDTNGNLKFSAANPYISASSWIAFPGGAYFSGGTVYAEAVIQARGGLHNDTGTYLNITGGTSGYTYFSGNVGIGSTAPAQKLHVVGNVYIDTSSSATGLLFSGAGAHRLFSDASAGMWVLSPSSSYVPRLFLGDSYDWDRQVAFTYTPSTTGSYAGNLAIGQTTKNNANYTHGITSFYTNGAERMRINASGNVGIGSTAPSAKLTVYDVFSGDLLSIGHSDLYQFSFKRSGSTGALEIQGNQTGANNIVLAPTSGNVGIGTTSPSSPLHVYSTSTVPVIRFYRSGAAGEGNFNINNAMSSSTSDIIYTTNPDGAGTGGHAFYVDNGTTTSFAMGISNAGNVGIGTTSPGYKLDLGSSGILKLSENNGTTDAVLTNSVANLLSYYVDNTNWAGIGRDANGTLQIAARRATFGHIDFETGGNKVMRVAASGNVGIGTTSPTAYLHFKAGTATASTAPLKFTSGTNLTTAEAGAMEYNGTQLFFSPSTTRNILAQVSGATALTTGSIPFATTSGYFTQDNANLFWDNGNDRLGIGTATPSAKLSIMGAYGTTPGADAFLHTNNWMFRVSNSNSDIFNIDSYSTTGGSWGSRVAIDRNNGNVGIGTTSPTAYLHLKAGTATASTAPLKFTAGTNLTTTEAGAVEYDGSHLYFSATNGGARYQLDQQDGTGANTALSNLASVAINTSLISDADSTDNLGSTANYWANTYSDKIFTDIIAPHADGTTALQINKADGTTNVLNVDTTNGRLGIGDTSPVAMFTVGSGDLFQVNSSGQIAATAGYTQGSGNFSISGTGTFGTGTGAISLNGDTTIASGKDLVLTSGAGTFSQDYSGILTAASITADSLTSGNILSLSSGSTAASAGNTGLNIAIYGANGTESITRYGLQSNVTATGTTNTNVAGYFSATGATNNYGLIVNGGSVGIGTASPTAQLHTTGTVRFANFGEGTLMTDASGNLSVSSDERLKNIDGSFNRGIDELMGINPISFHWNKNSGMDMENFYVGFSAQNIQDNIPEAVGIDHRGFLTLSDRPILATVVNSIKQQQGQISLISGDQDAISKDFSELSISNQDLVVKTEQSVTTLEELQDSVDRQLSILDSNSKDLMGQVDGLKSQLDKTDLLTGGLNERIVTLENQIKIIEEQNKTIIDFALALNVESLIYKDISGNLNLGEGKLEASGIVAGVFTVKVVDADAKTIGEAEILPAEAEESENDGKSILVLTKAVTKSSKIFITPQSDPGGYIWAQKVFDKEKNKYTGFEIKLKNPVEQKVKIDWWIVEEESVNGETKN